jgi:hypothetical protein
MQRALRARGFADFQNISRSYRKRMVDYTGLQIHLRCLITPFMAVKHGANGSVI